ncbi:hypothetical protein ABBQ32_012028 [Trebouxia sp. C0010 RCD-2024]
MQSSVLLHTSSVRPSCFHTTQARTSGVRRAPQQICCAHGQNKRDAINLRLVAASCAAALLLQSSPANAKVIFEPVQTKKVFQGAAESVKQAASEAKDAVSSGGLPSAPSIGLPKVNLPKLTPTIFSDSGDIDPRAVALPGALLAIGGGALVLSKIDPGFNEFMGSTSAKDSSTSGAGYEQGLKSGADELVKGGKAAKKKVGATINKKANTGGKQKKASASKGGGLRGLFGGAAGSK